MVTVKGIALDNFALLEFSRAVSSECNLVLHTKRNIPKEIAFRKIQSNKVPLSFLVVHATQHLVETVFLVLYTVHMCGLGISLWI